MTPERLRYLARERFNVHPRVRTLAVPLLFGVVLGLLPSGAFGGYAKPLLDWAKRVATEASKRQGNIREILNGFEPLSPSDDALEPEYPLGPGHGLPSRCFRDYQPFAGESPIQGPAWRTCKECGFGPALELLDSTRYRLEKLRRVGAATKNLISQSLAFGDSMAGAAGVGGLQWVVSRQEIVQSYENFKQSYDAKYIQLMGLLQQSLQQISRCEMLLFGEEDWYDRYGFMYHDFMAARYARPD